MSQVAFELEMDFRPNDEWGLLSLLEDFHLFSKGRRRRVYNLMEKRDVFLDERFQIFDYSYRVHRGKARRKYRQTVFFIQSKDLVLPEFFLKPENFFHKIGSLLGMQDIDFEDFEQFSRRYLLQGEDEELVRDMMQEPVLNFFQVERNWSIQGVGYFLVIYRHNHLLSPVSIRDFYRKGLEIYDLLRSKKG